MRIQMMMPGDSSAAAALSADLGYPVGPSDMADRVAAVLASPGDALFGAKHDDGALLGFVHVRLRMLLIDDLSAFVESLVVVEAARRGGVGRALMAAAEDWARGRGAHCIRLRSGASRHDAHAFYRSLGYADGKAALGFEKVL
ncbi:MAG: GNAT family N-acetyltransferase [Acidimicrobiia bacterium]|nr:GNAT family N-acetyltransferase [Acidimicrobiia bacterium]